MEPEKYWMIIHLVKGRKMNAVSNPFPNKPWFLRVYSKRLLKTLWEKEKLLVTENFLPSLSNLELLSANPFSLEEPEIGRLGKDGMIVARTI